MSQSLESILGMLTDMGFSEIAAKKALMETNYAGVEQAVDWLQEHADDDDLEEPIDEAAAAAAAAAEQPTKPLTDEEKAEQMKKLEELRVRNRKEREERERKEEIEKERKRLADAKDMAELRDKVNTQEAKKAADELRREKEETRIAKDRVKAQIEADKLARREKEAARLGQPPAAAAGAAPPPPNAANAQPPPAKKDYSEARLQIRLPDGSALVQTFKAKEPLSAVRLYVELNRKDGLCGPVKFMTNFPKKVFTDEDMEKPLETLSLVPSAALIVTK